VGCLGLTDAGMVQNWTEKAKTKKMGGITRAYARRS
jgi:hypothetical protein